ncbi:unnamed protein product [Protopolystoma xenopodis]|uniref:Uncharacterized protein n=1 Tax=Protopolystoma xenopodis TaxID=117903 RepID=A0A3S5CDP2_9PLAT|nr:unnamed protein product [Protopolystoma xenopodis]
MSTVCSGYTGLMEMMLREGNAQYSQARESEPRRYDDKATLYVLLKAGAPAVKVHWDRNRMKSVNQKDKKPTYSPMRQIGTGG